MDQVFYQLGYKWTLSKPLEDGGIVADPEHDSFAPLSPEIVIHMSWVGVFFD